MGSRLSQDQWTIFSDYQLEFSPGKITGTLIRSFSDHTHYIQGVFWDPLNKFIVSQSADRSLNVYQILPSESNSIEINFRHKFQNLEIYICIIQRLCSPF